MKRMEPEHWEKQLAKLPLRQGGFSKELMEKVKESVESAPPQRRKSIWLRLLPAAALTAAAAVGATQADALLEGLSKLSKTREPAALEAMDTDKKIVLKVGNFRDPAFMKHYGNAFMARYPNITLQVEAPGGLALWSSAAKVELDDWLEKEKPDVLVLSPDQYERLAGSGKLYPLDAAVKQDGFDLQNIYAGVTSELRAIGGGKLYGLAPEYEQLALYYNKDLFDRYKVSYPANGMSWEELLQLAGKFASDGKSKEKAYGLAVAPGSSPFELIRTAGSALGLSLTDAAGKRATIDTPQWKLLWSELLKAYRSGAVYQPPQRGASAPPEEAYRSDAFLAGQAAMTLQSYRYTADLARAQQDKLPSFSWRIVTEPTASAEPDRSVSFSLGTVYAVYADSSHLRAAWELVKFINSEESAKSMLSLSPGGFSPSRLPSLASSGIAGKGSGLEAFYTLRPAERPRPAADVPASFYRTVEELALQQSEAVLSGKKTIDAALRELQAQGQQALTRARTDAPKR